MRQIFQALKWCAEKETVHADLSDSNVLVDMPGGHVYLIDFGFSHKENEVWNTALPGTFKFMSPEHFNSNGIYHASMDMWSAGVIFKELLDKLRLPHSYWANDLISKLKQRNPQKRLSPEEALNHPFLCREKHESTQDKIRKQSMSKKIKRDLMF